MVFGVRRNGMRTITFYSYKGGVGRTLAAVNFAVYLAKLGLKTVLIDFDIEAPGVDAKFPLLKISDNQKGLLDYIVEYQETNEGSGTIQHICLKVPLEASDNNTSLWLIPAGQYLKSEYYKKLSQLDWNLIFSEHRNGVAFFQQFLACIEQELQAEYVIIDSRTGITEIAGLCTQQLADEVIILSSLSGESIKLTKHIKQLILKSKVAKALEKSIEVKVIASRVPRPDDLDVFKEECCKTFEIEDNKLFFLFSSQVLERKEFIAIAESNRDEELFSNYIKLFYGLNIKIADEKILSEVEKIVSNILSVPVEESEKKILEMVSLYPHPEVYRRAMRFFQLARKEKEQRIYAEKLFEFMPDDEEVQKVISKMYFNSNNRLKKNQKTNKIALRAIEALWQKCQLTPQETSLYASELEELEQYSKSIEVSLSLYKDENVDYNVKIKACLIAIKNAFKLGNINLATELIEDVPAEYIDTSLALQAIKELEVSKDFNSAFTVAKKALHNEFNDKILERAIALANQLNRMEDLQELLSLRK